MSLRRYQGPHPPRSLSCTRSGLWVGRHAEAAPARCAGQSITPETLRDVAPDPICRHETPEEELKQVQQLGGVSSRAGPLISSIGGAYYFPGVKRAVQEGLW